MSKRKTICLLTAAPDSFHSKRIGSGVSCQCAQYGYDLAVFSAMINLNFPYAEYAQGEQNIYELVNFSRFDGIIMDTISLTFYNKSDLIEALLARIHAQTDAPVVSIGIPFEGTEYVKNENEELFRTLCRHAIEVHGCREICVLTGQKDNHEAEERLAVLVDEAHRHGLEIKPEHRVYGDFWYTSGTQLAQDIVSGKISKPDAVIAASDHMALGFIDEYARLGQRVPEDMVVLGFEATSDAMLADIPLTSIESNFEKCAADAVDRIRRRLEPDEPVTPFVPEHEAMLHTGLSCGCPPDIKRSMDTLKFQLYYMNHNYNQSTFADNIDIGLLMESYISERLTRSASPDECIRSIYDSSYIVSPYINFFLCLRPDWLDTAADTVTGYPDRMTLMVLSSYNGLEPVFLPEHRTEFDTADMLPYLFEEHYEPSVFYFSPVHFEEKMLGYAVLQRHFRDGCKYNLVYRNWLRFVNNALEMARTKNRYVVLSVYDKMTGLYNRRGMYQELSRLTVGMTADKELFVCVIDMDGLKYINDTFGHSEGDHGILRIADAVRAIAAEEDICCRAGGDEFYVTGLRSKGCFDAADYISRFTEILAKLSGNDGKPYSITASIGCAVSKNQPELDFEALLSEADVNMYKHKVRMKRRREDFKDSGTESP